MIIIDDKKENIVPLIVDKILIDLYRRKNMTLSQGIPGTIYNVLEVHEEASIERRLAALGLISGTKITLLNKKKRGAVIFSVRGTRFAIGQSIADGILVEVAES